MYSFWRIVSQSVFFEQTDPSASSSPSVNSAAVSAALDPYRFASYNSHMAAAAAARAESASYFGSAAAHGAAASALTHGAASALTPYAAYAAQNMMHNWNSYSMASFQNLQRAGVTYGRTLHSFIFI